MTNLKILLIFINLIQKYGFIYSRRLAERLQSTRNLGGGRLVNKAAFHSPFRKDRDSKDCSLILTYDLYLIIGSGVLIIDANMLKC